MPKVGPIKRRDLISGLRKAGFTGPEAGGKHGVMRRGEITIPIPNPHHGDISKPFLLRILDEAGISREEWEAL